MSRVSRRLFRLEDEELSASGPKGSLFSFLEGGLHAAFSAISSAVCSGVAIVSGTPSKRARVDTVQQAGCCQRTPAIRCTPRLCPPPLPPSPPPASPRAAEQHSGTPTKRLASFHSSFAPPSPSPRDAVCSPTRRSGGGGGLQSQTRCSHRRSLMQSCAIRGQGLTCACVCVLLEKPSVVFACPDTWCLSCCVDGAAL